MTSYQLPDLLAIIRNADFTLRANHHCHAASTSSEAWLAETLSEEEATLWRSIRATKVGVLAALCFPCADLAKLRLATDLMSLIILGNATVSYRCTNRLERDDGRRSPVYASGPLRHISTRLSQVVKTADDGWRARFSQSVIAYRAAQEKVMGDKAQGVFPDLDSYMALKRDLSGLRMLFNFAELSGRIKLPSETLETFDLTKLANRAIDIITCSMDIVSYNIDQAKGNRHNLVHILIVERQLSVQGAITHATGLFKQSLDAFLELEKKILDPTTSTQSLWSFSFLSSSLFSSSASPPSSSPISEDTRAYIRALRDCIAGYPNWAYETEMYFEEKGESARTFGWVFLSALPVENT